MRGNGGLKGSLVWEGIAPSGILLLQQGKCVLLLKSWPWERSVSARLGEVWFSLTIEQFIWLAASLAAVALLVVIGLTRPGLRRLFGALLGGFFFAALALVLDRMAFSLALWHYPFTHSSFGPLGFYIAAGLFYGAGMALIGWRIARRFGRPGVLILLSCFAVYGPLRDELGSALASRTGFEVLVFAPGPLPVLADALCWVVCVGGALLVMRLVAGPAQADRLAQQRVARASRETSLPQTARKVGPCPDADESKPEGKRRG